MMVKNQQKDRQFGDFQTPHELAAEAVACLARHMSFEPRSIIEPTCGVGSFLLAAADTYPYAEKIFGMEINAEYLNTLRQSLSRKDYASRVELIRGDFFKADWDALLRNTPKPILVIGNPPWVTNSEIGAQRGDNLPKKTNFQKHKGFEAVTGKSNFDISEWMIIRHLEWLRSHSGAVAMLCKTAVARKILRHAWKNAIPTVSCKMVQIDAMQHFSAAVDACFFIIESNHSQSSTDCAYYSNFDDDVPEQIFGYHEGMMLSDVPSFYAHHNLFGKEPSYTWRSGIKHDCSKVMELKIEGNRLINGSHKEVTIEEEFLYPLLKSSDLANGRTKSPRLKVLVTQRAIGDDTSIIAKSAPKTWQYLIANRAALDRRGSTIYRNKPPFSIFGVGEYSFSEWKVAISGFYKRLHFEVIPPSHGKPTMLDDTCYFLSCNTKKEAEFLCDILNSETCKEALSSMIFWSDKRPITIDLLKRLSIASLARRLGRSDEYDRFAVKRDNASRRKDRAAQRGSRGDDLFFLGDESDEAPLLKGIR